MWAFTYATTAVVWCLLCSEIKSMPGHTTMSESTMMLTTSMPPTTPTDDIMDDMTAEEINQEMDQMMMLPDTKMKGDMTAACPPSPPSLLAAVMHCEHQYEMIMANLTGMSDMMNETSGEKMKTEELKQEPKHSNNMIMTAMKSCSYQCILQNLGVLDNEGMPHEETFTQWLMNNTMMDHSETTKLALQEQVSKCFMSLHDHDVSNMTNTTMPNNEGKHSNMSADKKMMDKEMMSKEHHDQGMTKKQDDMMAQEKGGMMMPTHQEDMECHYAMALIACLEKDQKCSSFRKDVAA